MIERPEQSIGMGVNGLHKAPKIHMTSFVGPFDETNTQRFMDNINWANNNTNAERILMTLSSRGGTLDSATAAYEHVKMSRIPVDIVAQGFCGSAAVAVLQAGERRLTTPNTYFFIHEVRNTYATGTEEEIEIDREFCKEWGKNFILLTLSKSRKLDAEKFKNLYTPKKYLKTDEAIKYGLVDEVFSYPERTIRSEELLAINGDNGHISLGESHLIVTNP